MLSCGLSAHCVPSGLEFEAAGGSIIGYCLSNNLFVSRALSPSKHEQSMNHISLIIQAYMLSNVTHCALRRLVYCIAGNIGGH